MAQISHGHTLKEKAQQLVHGPRVTTQPCQDPEHRSRGLLRLKGSQYLSAVSIVRAGQTRGLAQPQSHRNTSSECAENHHQRYAVFSPTKCLCAGMPGASQGKWNSWTLNSEESSAARQEQLPEACALFFGFPSSQPRALGDWREARTVEPNVNPKTMTRFPSPLCFTLPFLLTHRKRQILTGRFSPFSFYLKNVILHLPLTTPSPYTGL